MNPRSLRRLAADHASLHNQELPPNYLFDPKVDPSSDLTQLDILLAGPTSTPYEAGVFRLHLAIPPTYPTNPPKAFFRTKIFHPNIEPETGAVCVETLKRDWQSTLTLRHVLLTISCLLVYPNATSALNAEAGMLLEQQGGAGWEGFERRARLMTRLQAAVPKHLKDAVTEARSRGEEKASGEDKTNGKEGQDLERKDSALDQAEAINERAERPRRRRRGVFDVQEGPTTRGKRNLTPTPTPAPKLAPPLSPSIMPPPPRPFVVQSSADDVFGEIHLPHPSQQTPRFPSHTTDARSDPELHSAYEDQNADTNPLATKPSLHPSPVRQDPAIPPSEVRATNARDDDAESSPFLSDCVDAEYPPSPRKSPVKQQRKSDDFYAEPGPPSPRKESPRKLRAPAPEYPPSPQKQSPKKNRRPLFGQHGPEEAGANLFGPSLDSGSGADGSSSISQRLPNLCSRGESSRTAAARRAGPPLFFTPDNSSNQMHPALFSTQQNGTTPDLLSGMTEDSEFEVSFEVLRQSERRKKCLLASPPKRKLRARNLRGKSDNMATPEVIEREDESLLEPSEIISRVTRSKKKEVAEKGRATAVAENADDDTALASVSAPVSARTTRKKTNRPKPKTRTKTKTQTQMNSSSPDKAILDQINHKTTEEKNKERLEAKLWNLCGRDIERWNKGDFGDYFHIKASRW